MMKKLLIMISMLFVFTNSKACDICGCGVGSYYLGILPEFNQKFGGIRYQHKTVETHLGPTGDRTAITEDETYQSIELWGGWNIGKKFRVLGFVPYNFNEKKSQLSTLKQDGLGDIAVMGYYNLFNGMTTVKQKMLVQSLWIGAGVKVPTGKYQSSERVLGSSDANLYQLGTASTDFTINAAYDIRLMDFGVNTNVNYKMNTENRYEYRYGNKFTANMLAYYKIKASKNLTLSPNAGVLYETSAKDVEQNKYDVETSGGYSTAGILGVEAVMKKVSFGANYQNVLSQELAKGRIKAGDRFLVHVSYAF